MTPSPRLLHWFRMPITLLLDLDDTLLDTNVEAFLPAYYCGAGGESAATWCRRMRCWAPCARA